MSDHPARSLNPPRQNRSQRTLERLVRASLDILDEQGATALTVQAIVTRADSSVGSFYARFKGKDDLLDYLGERVWQEALDRWNTSVSSHDWSELDLRQLAEGSVRLLSDAQRSRSSYLKSLDRAAGRNDDAYVRFRRPLLDGIGTLLLARSDEIAHVRPDLAVRFGLLAVLGLIDADDPGGGTPLPPGVLVRAATDILVGYLSPASPPLEDEGEVAFFDIWG